MTFCLQTSENWDLFTKVFISRFLFPETFFSVTFLQRFCICTVQLSVAGSKKTRYMKWSGCYRGTAIDKFLFLVVHSFFMLLKYFTFENKQYCFACTAIKTKIYFLTPIWMDKFDGHEIESNQFTKN